jgi:hypothetical protein
MALTKSAVALSLRLLVVRPHSCSPPLLIQLDHVQRTIAVLAPVQQGVTTRADQERLFDESQIRRKFQTSLEVAAQLRLSLQPPIWPIPAVHHRRRREVDVIRVGRHDSVQVTGFPSRQPLISMCSRIHVDQYPDEPGVPAMEYQQLARPCSTRTSHPFRDRPHATLERPHARTAIRTSPMRSGPEAGLSQVADSDASPSIPRMALPAPSSSATRRAGVPSERHDLDAAALIVDVSESQDDLGRSQTGRSDRFAGGQARPRGRRAAPTAQAPPPLEWP